MRLYLFGAALVAALAFGALGTAVPAFADPSGGGSGGATVQRESCTLILTGTPTVGTAHVVTTPSGNQNLQCHTQHQAPAPSSGGAAQVTTTCVLMLNGTTTMGTAHYVTTPSGNQSYHCHAQ